MKSITRDELKSLAKSLYFELEEKQIDELQQEFTSLFESFENVSKLNVDNLFPTNWETINKENVFFSISVGDVFDAMPTTFGVDNGRREKRLNICTLIELALIHLSPVGADKSLFLQFMRVNFGLFHNIILSARLWSNRPTNFFNYFLQA